MRSLLVAAALAVTAIAAATSAVGAQTALNPRAMNADAAAAHDGMRHGESWRSEDRAAWAHGAMRLTPEERHKLIAARFAAMDANHDGRVSFEEFRAYRERMRAERQRDRFRRLAGGGDALTLERLEALSGDRHEGGRGWGGEGGMAGRSGAR